MRCSKADLEPMLCRQPCLVPCAGPPTSSDQDKGRKNKKGGPAEAAASLVSSDVSRGSRVRPGSSQILFWASQVCATTTLPLQSWVSSHESRVSSRLQSSVLISLCRPSSLPWLSHAYLTRGGSYKLFPHLQRRPNPCSSHPSPSATQSTNPCDELGPGPRPRPRPRPPGPDPSPPQHYRGLRAMGTGAQQPYTFLPGSPVSPQLTEAVPVVRAMETDDRPAAPR